MKNNSSAKKIFKIQRYFDTGIVNEGVFILPKQELLKCKELALRVLSRAGLIFPRESEFYGIIEPLISSHQTFNDYTEWDWEFFNSIINAKFQLKEKTQQNQNWYVHSSNFRLTKNVIGRNIRSRYYSSADQS